TRTARRRTCPGSAIWPATSARIRPASALPSIRVATRRLYPAHMWENADRATLQAAVRAVAIVVVVAWLFSDDLRAWVPVWVPIVLLLAAEIEFVLRGRREAPRAATPRVPPGADAARRGVGEIVEDDEGIRFVP